MVSLSLALLNFVLARVLATGVIGLSLLRGHEAHLPGVE